MSPQVLRVSVSDLDICMQNHKKLASTRREHCVSSPGSLHADGRPRARRVGRNVNRRRSLRHRRRRTQRERDQSERRPLLLLAALSHSLRCVRGLGQVGQLVPLRRRSLRSVRPQQALALLWLPV